MWKRWICVACLLAALVYWPPVSAAQADGREVLLLSAASDATDILAGLITACGMTPVTVEKTDYTPDMAELYDYFVLEDPKPLEDILRLDKQALCVGKAFETQQWVKTDTIRRVTTARMRLGDTVQSVVLKPDTVVITDDTGEWEPFGSIETRDGWYPIGVMRETIYYVPDMAADSLSVFAVAQMMNRYFGREDGGEFFVTIDSVTPLHDPAMLTMIADMFYEYGLAFIVTLRPIYYNTDYPSFVRYCNALLYMQSKGASFVMQDPISTGNELVGDTLDERMEKAYENFAAYGIVPVSKDGFPFAVTADWLQSLTGEGNAAVRLPIDTTFVYDVFETREELDVAVRNINSLWLPIGSYSRDAYKPYRPLPVDGDFVYTDATQQRFASLMSQGNRLLRILVAISGVVIIGLLIWGWRLYRKKFISDAPKPNGKDQQA